MSKTNFGQQTLCPSCGASNAAGNKFCLSCGGSLAAAPLPVQPSVARGGAPETPPPAATTPTQRQESACPSCGASNPPGNKFCLACGGSLMVTVQLFQPNETMLASAPPEPITAAAAAAPEQRGGDMDTPDVSATMAAAAAASPASQPLPLVAPPREAPEPPAATSAPAPHGLEQPSLAWEASQAEPAKPPQQTCAACGAATSEGQKFCLACGAPVGQRAPVTASASVAEPEPTGAEQKVCAACNAALSQGQKFCLSCGTPVAQDDTVARVPSAPPAPVAEPYTDTSEAQLFQTPRRSSVKTLVLVVVLLAALGAGGWYGWKYFARPDVTVTTFPQKTHVAIGGKTSLQASVSGSTDTDITWTIQEGNKGGQVVDLGAVMASGQLRAGATYNAPQTSGVFHVIAASHANPSRSAKTEIVVGGSQQADTTTPPPQPVPIPTPTPASPTTTSTNPMAGQIVGTWRGPSPGMQTIIGADSTISMTSETDAAKNLSGTYRFTDKSHLDVDFGGGDVRKWEIVAVDSNYLRVTSQSKDGTAAIVFAKIQ